MNWLSRWLDRGHTDTTDEARAALAAATGRDAEVAALGAELAEIHRRNHFSAMVAMAITRISEEV